MKKRLICLLTVLALVLGLVPTALAADLPVFSGQCSNAISWTLDPEEGILTISGTGAIPDYSFGETAPWYPYRSRIFRVVLTKNITGIGSFAFYECSRLTELDASTCTLSTIGAGAMESCITLSVFSFTPAAQLTVGEDAFAGCCALKELKLGAAQGEIGAGAFANCTALTKLTLPKALTRLERETFCECKALSDIVLPEGLTYIGRRCFYGCLGLTELVLPASLTEIERKAFDACGNLKPVFSGDAPELAAADTLSNSFLPAGVLYVPYDAKGWSWPLHKGYYVSLIFPSLDNIFKDLAKNAWYVPSVQYVYYFGLMNGMREGEFEPTKPMTRAQLVTVLYRIADEPEITADNPFKDVKATAYYYDAVLWAQKNGIVTGVTSTTFVPEAQVSRQQVCTILYRYAAMLGLKLNVRDTLEDFVDAGQVDNYARDPMGWCVAMELINGKPGGKLDPKGTATRAEIAKILAAFDTYLALQEQLAADSWKEAYEDPDDPGVNPDDPLYVYAKEILETVNKTRAAGGQNALQWDDWIYLAAQTRAAELATENGFSHDRPDGTKYSTVFTQFKITCNTRNEIIARGYTTAQSLVDVWSTTSATSSVLSAQVYSKAAVGVYQAPPAEGEQVGKYYYVLLVTD